MMRLDIPTSDTVQRVRIWNVIQSDNNEYDVLFSVDQQITVIKKKTAITSAYNVQVYMDKNGNLVIIKSPTINSSPKKSTYQPKTLESDGTVAPVKQERSIVFLKHFLNSTQQQPKKNWLTMSAITRYQ
jgi:hypothetical protein